MRRYMFLFMVLGLMCLSTNLDAQRGKRYYINTGWQFNATLNNPVAESAQAYGAYLESGFYVTPLLAVGGFASFNTNNEYVPSRTYYYDDQSALTTDMYRSLYQVPFGSTVRFRFLRTNLQPYVEAKIGTQYSTQTTYFSEYLVTDHNFGFYISPEVGLSWYPFASTDFGFQFAVFYSYATNRNDAYNLNGINNLGLKLGVAF